MGDEREPVMNARRLLLVSLALNVALGVLAAWLFAQPGGGDRSSVAERLAQRTIRVRKVVRESAPQVVAMNAPFHWSEVESADYRVYMQNLRAIGCPERTIRDIILADVDDLFTEKLRELMAPAHRGFWRLLAEQDSIKEASEGYERAWEALKKERAEVFKELLGREDPRKTDEEDVQASGRRTWEMQLLDFLATEQQDLVIGLRRDFDEATRKVWETGHQLTQAEVDERRRQVKELEAERDGQLAKVLTPEELSEYQLRTGPGADAFRRLSRIEFSDDEGRAIAHAAQERQRAMTQSGENKPDANERRAEAERQFQTQLKDALGEARFQDYQRASDYRFDQVSAVAERLELPESKAIEVYQMRVESEKQAASIRQEKTLADEVRAGLLAGIRDETDRSVRAALGDTGFAVYAKHGGDWISALATSSTSPP